jgi:hypothetical protein
MPGIAAKPPIYGIDMLCVALSPGDTHISAVGMLYKGWTTAG